MRRRPHRCEDSSRSLEGDLSRKSFLSVLVAVGFHRLVSVIARAARVAAGRMCVMGRLLVLTALVVLGRLAMMAGSFGIMLRRFLVMVRCAFRHVMIRLADLFN